MTDLRCNYLVHGKALGSILEVRCRKCGVALSAPGHKVTVYHRWDYRDGLWQHLNDRMVVAQDDRQAA